ncbi:S-layer homology domain-containing protein [Caloramator quimbayensis]|uniref:S-layer homology domain-containing protein n=1 Tax=Caloramator quimbayensis TaxID=1147123 RepID=A0A1T4Y1P2_9CLOT|nr:PepSY domain-containing protein [Caloramator quimbayensis]SKA95712.1 S-layer homology domain-containing protein [Caloramator quimbayensis]
MKKVISFIIAIFMIVECFYPLKASAEDKITSSKAIEIAKSSFNLNTEGYNLNQNYIETNNRKVYELNWYSKKKDGGSIYVSVDAKTGEIINMSMWDGSTYTPRKIPKYSKSSAKAAAEEIVRKLQPDKFQKIKLIDNVNNIYDSDYYSDVYTFYFIRIENGIEVSDNGITVSVDKNSLKIRSYNLNWDNIEIPDISKVIGIDEAKEIFKEKLGLELSYSMSYNANSKKNTPILVYSLKNGNMPIDAFSGDIIKNGYYTPYINGLNKEDSKGSSQAGNLTVEEQKVIDVSSKYISKEKAIEIASKYLPLNEKYKLSSANLYSNNNNDTALWYLYWENSDPSAKIYNYMNAQIDAVNSEIKSFYYGGSDFDQPAKDKKPLYDKEKAKKIADDFIMSIYPDKFNQIEYKETNDYYAFNEENYVPSIYYFTYIRKTDGITYNFDSITVNVNTYTGKVTGFSMNWSNNLELPSKEGVIDIDKAYDILFSKLNFSLKFVKCYDYTKIDNQPKIKLAYVLTPFSGNMDAKSGSILDYSGNPIKIQKTPEYTDIKGNPNENNIKLLAEIGILKGTDNKFRPNDNILQKDFIKLLILSIDPYSYTLDDSYETYYEQAVNKKIISEKEKNPESEVTRQQAAKMIVKALGIGFVADITNMYDISRFKDGNSISPEYKGYVAISSELKVINTNDSYIYPLKSVSRGEAATIIVNFLNVNTDSKE